MSLELGRAFWQFELSGVSLRPRLVTWGKVGDIEGEFWLKVWGERLLFCAAAEPQKVFAVTTPCLQDQNLLAFWRLGIDDGQFGRLVMSQQALTSAEETDTAFLFICMEDGSRWMREWCGGAWQASKDAPKSPLPVWHPRWEVLGDARTNHVVEDLLSLHVPEQTLQKLLLRPFPDVERIDCPILWLKGSQSEWKRVVQAYITLHFGRLERPAHYRYSGVQEGTYRFYYFSHTPFFESRINGIWDWLGGQLPEPWKVLFARHFVCVGWNWKRRKKNNEQLREGWKGSVRTQSAQIHLSKSPSQHERLEAMLFLRSWLRGKVAEEEVDGLVGAE